MKNARDTASKAVGGDKVNMLHGPLLRPMLSFAVPLIAGGVLQQSFNSADIAIAGRYAGSTALAAVGSNGPVIGLFINLFLGLAVGVNVVIANYIGQRNERGAAAAAAMSAVLSVLCGLLMGLLTFSLAEPLLRLLDTPAEVIGQAAEYLRIFAVGMPFFLVYNFGAAVLRAVGDTRRPFYSLVAAGCINVALNFIFVAGVDMGVAGVAWGTVIASAANAGIILFLLRRERSCVRLVMPRLRGNMAEAAKIVRIGLPAGVQSTVFSISNVFILGAINTFGANASAGSAVSLIFESYCYFVILAFGQTATAFTGQNYGAGKGDRCRRILRLSLLMSVAATAALNLGLYLCRHQALTLFTADADVIAFGAERMAVVLLFQFTACYYEMSGSVMRGMEHSLTPAVITIFGTCVLRLLWVALLPAGASFGTLLAVYPASWLLTDAMMYAAMRRYSRQLR